MPDLDFLVEVGPEVKIKLTENTERRSELLLNLPLRAAISLDGFNSTGRGFVFGPELEYKIDEYLSPRNELSLRWSPSWATRDYMDFFYTVPPEFETAVRPGVRSVIRLSDVGVQDRPEAPDYGSPALHRLRSRMGQQRRGQRERPTLRGRRQLGNTGSADMDVLEEQENRGR